MNSPKVKRNSAGLKVASPEVSDGVQTGTGRFFTKMTAELKANSC